MRNSFEGTCYRCGKTCAPGQGHFEKVSRKTRAKWGSRVPGKWLVQHAECAIRYRGTDAHYLFQPEGEEFVIPETIFG